MNCFLGGSDYLSAVFLRFFLNEQDISAYLEDVEGLFSTNSFSESSMRPFCKSAPKTPRTNSLQIRNYFWYTTFSIPFWDLWDIKD
jgi:hypothetical protein